MAASYTKNAPHARGWRCGKGFGLQFRAASVARRGGPFLRVGVQEPGAGVCAPKEEKAMKKKNPLGLRVLSAAAVTSIATPAFADIYYIGNGSIDVIAEKGTDYVTVKQGNKEYHDTSREIVLKDGTSEDDTTLKENIRPEDKRAEDANKKQTTAVTTIGETEVTPAEEEPEEEEPTEKVEKETPAEEPKAEPEGETKEQPEEPKAAPAAEEEPKEEEQEEEPKVAAGDEQPKESVEETDTEETTDEAAEETDDTEETEDKDAVPDAKDETPTEDAEQKIAKAPVKQQPEAAAQGDAADQDKPEPPAKGSEGNPTNNVIRVINNWVENTLNIRLSNVHIKADNDSKYQDGKTESGGRVPSMKVDGSGNTTIELDGQNVLDASGTYYQAGLNKQGEGTMTITDTTNDKGQQITSKEFDNDQSGSLTAKGDDGAGIGGNHGESTKNITLEGFATVDAKSSGWAAGIGGGMYGDAENITIQGNAHVTAKAYNGAAIGGGSPFDTGVASSQKYCDTGSAKGIVIQDHAVVNAETTGYGAGIGSGGYNRSSDAEVTIGTEGADSTTGDVQVTAKSKYGAAIGGGGNRTKGTTKVTIQGNATIEEASSYGGAAIGSPYGDATVTIKDHAYVKKAQVTDNQANYPAIGGSYGDKVEVNLEGNAVLDKVLGAIGAGTSVKNTVINIKDNVRIGTIETTRYYGGAIGGETTKDTETTTGNKVTVNIDGGKDGKVEIGTDGGVKGDLCAINGTKVNLLGKILLKLKQNRGTYSSGDDYDGIYLSEGLFNDKAEMKVGSTKKPEEGGLLNTIDANSAIWYTDYNNKLVKIVHGENLCKFDETGKPDRIIEPTCTTPGYKVYKCHYEKNNEAGTPCSDPCCDREKWVEYTGALGHKETDLGEDKVHHDATCVKGGYWEGTCKTCGQKVEVPDGTEPDLTKHDYEGQEWVTTKEATCGAAGEKVLHCKRAPNDPSHDKTEMIPATGKHTWDEGKVTKAPTCTEEGEKTFTCTGCNETKTEKIPVDPNAHDYRDDWTVTTKPGCTTKGEETRHCHNNPEHTETRDIAPTGHEKTHVVGKKDPTETEPGYTGDEVCDKCGDVVKKGEVIPATGKMDAENAETLELRVVVPGNTLQDLLFTVRQADGERTYTCKKADATLTGTLETLQYLQANGAETIVFVTNGRVSRFAVADLLALCDEGDVFYLCHTADAEPTLLIIANDHTELLNK